MRLSFCIPVFNGGEFIVETLDSIFREAGGRQDVEVVIFDGGSSDDTEQQVRSFMRSERRLRYQRADKRGGIDKDLCSCVAMATGEFCWLFSAHELLAVGAISALEGFLDDRRSLILIRHTNCTIDMVEFGKHPILSDSSAFEADFAKESERIEWLRRGANTEAAFSFISSIVVRRTAWERGALDSRFEGSCWGHVARFFGINSDFVIFAPPDFLVRQRGGPDSFSDNGLIRRYALAIDGYLNLTRFYFGAGPELAEIRRLLRAEYGLNQFLAGRLACAQSPLRESRELLDRLFGELYDEPKTLRDIVRRWLYRWAPLHLYNAARESVRMTRRWRRGVSRASERK